MRRPLAAFGLLVLLIHGAARADAPAPASASVRSARVREGLRGDALAAFDRGTILFASRSFAPARAEFERAHELSGDPRILYNVAVCDKEQGRYARAIDELKQSLREWGTSPPSAYVEQANDTIALLSPLVTALVVHCDEAGARILIDGQDVGATPSGPVPINLPIDVGEHDIAVRKPGLVDFATHVTVLGGKGIEVVAPLDGGRLKVTATGGPPNAHASVLVDGADVGDAPWEGKVTAGAHELAVRAPGYAAPSRRIVVGPGESLALELSLEPDARLRVNVDDPSAELSLDGRNIGRGTFDGPVTSGEHHLDVLGSGNAYRGEISLNRGETRSMSIQIRRGFEVPTWVWIGGGALVAGGITAAVLVATRTTKYEGSSPGTFNPSLVPTGLRVMEWR